MPRLQRDKTSLFYETAGGGTPPIVLVHGWGCDHTFLAPQFKAFQQHHRVVAVDLRGHGQSDKPKQDYTIGAFADDVAWICDRLALRRPLIVGHSMGGVIALEIAASRQIQLSGVVLLDSAVLPGPDVWSGAQSVRTALRTPGYRDQLRQFLESAFFLEAGDREFRATTVDKMLRTPQHVLASAFDAIFDWDSVTAVEQCEVPALYVASTRPRSDVTRLCELCSTLVDGKVVHSGHFVQLEVADQVTAMIRRFLRTN